MKNAETGWIEADVTIGGYPLSFPESMTLRVAVTSFRMFLSSDDVRRDLGAVAEGYDRCLQAIEERMHARKP